MICYRLMLGLVCFAATTTLCAADEAVSLFNGKDLAGWEGDAELWTVEDGAITGRTTAEKPLPFNKFLIWSGGEVENFELRLKFRLESQGNNSGVQYRSQHKEDVAKFAVGGYQADIHPAANACGMLYDERGRGVLADRGTKVVIDGEGQRWITRTAEKLEAIDLTQWHEMTIIAVGNKLTQAIDGETTIEVIDHDEKNRELKGIIAFQVHRGPVMKVQFKDILLKKLPAGGLLSIQDAPIPESAVKFERKPSAPKQPAPPGKGPGANTPKPATEAKPEAETSAQAQPESKKVAKLAAPAKATAPGKPAAPAVAKKEITATPAEELKVAKGFRVELLYTVPKDQEGSWVSMCTDPKGRLIVCDQHGGLFRVTLPPIGKSEGMKIDKIPVDIGEAQGLLWAFDSLYVSVNPAQKYKGGLYRVRDTNGDGELDQVETLRSLEGRGEHGPHAVLLAPDGQSLYVVCGNGTKLTSLAGSNVPLHYGEDHLLPRMPDGRGFMRDVLGPGGCIYQIDRDGKEWKLIANGFRNQYDAAFNRDGELFTYDADMEWDMNTPWYRPTRVNHVTSGAEFGWRNGAGKWPAYYVDSLPEVVNIGPGSPTGVTFGYGAKFPAKYQEAFYICDWSYGKLYATHLSADGSTYRGQLEEFVAGTPLPLTDLLINPHDGAMYFAIGGRKTQSGLYRVTYIGDESTAAIKLDAATPGGAERQVRRQLEAFHGHADAKAVEVAWPYLAHPDRHVRFAARTALEFQPLEAWQTRALEEQNPVAATYALLALVRSAAKDPFHGGSREGPSAQLRSQVLAALARIELSKLNLQQQLDLVRTYQVALNRLGRPTEEERTALLARFEPLYPARNRMLNVEILQILVFLESPTVAAKTVPMLTTAPTQEEQIDLARALRVLKTGWTTELRTAFFEWTLRAVNYRGGNSFELFVENIKRDAIATLTEAEKTELKAVLEAKPMRAPVAVLPPRKLVKEYTVDELVPKVAAGLKGRNFERGRQMFAAASCFACHRFDQEGGAIGPDLTGVAGRFNQRDLLESIVLPSKVISDQYGAVNIVTVNGQTIVGRIVNLSGDTIKVNTNMLDPNALVTVNRAEIEEMTPSPISMMPVGLFNTLTEDEILDLMAYLLSRGDAGSAMFGKK